MLCRLSREARQGLIPLARSALATSGAGRCEEAVAALAASDAGRCEEAAAALACGRGDSIIVAAAAGDPSTSASSFASSSSPSLSRSFHSRSSSSGLEERADASRQATLTGGILAHSSPKHGSQPLLLLGQRRKNNPTSLLCSSSPSSSSSFSTAAPSPRKLDDIMKLETLRDKTGEEIASIWTEFHRDDSKNRVGGTLSAQDYRAFTQHVAEAPMLVWPLRKEGLGGGGKEEGKEEGEKEKASSSSGLVVLLSQAQLPHILFTTVDEFRALGPDAPAHLVVTHYSELAAEKGVVLWRADVVSPALLVNSSSRLNPSSSSSSKASDSGLSTSTTEGEQEAKTTSTSTSSSDAARALVATAHALYADPEGRAHARAFNEAKGFDFEALMRYFGLKI